MRKMGALSSTEWLAKALGHCPCRSAQKGCLRPLSRPFKLAFRNSPQVKAAQFDLEASQSARKQLLGGYHPRVDLALGATRNDDMDGSPGANDDETAVIKMSYNLYRGGADRAKMKEAIARINAAEQALICAAAVNYARCEYPLE